MFALAACHAGQSPNNNSVVSAASEKVNAITRQSKPIPSKTRVHRLERKGETRCVASLNREDQIPKGCASMAER